jgi:flagellar protein FlaG
MNVSRVIIDQIDKFKFKSSIPDGSAASEHHGVDMEHDDVKEPTKSEITSAVDKLNSSVAKLRERITFSYHEGTNRVIMRVIDSETSEVIREIPAKNAIKLLEHIKEYLGMFVDESR